MKAKKVIKRLSKVEDLLTTIVDRYSPTDKKLVELLQTAKASVHQAKAGIGSTAPVAAKKTGPAPARKSRLSTAGRKRISDAAKRRWALARKKEPQGVQAKRLSQTA
jgi:hypothetical protein